MSVMNSVLTPILSGAIGALIGTYVGVLLTSAMNEKAKIPTRKLAIKAIDIFIKYAKKRGHMIKQNRNLILVSVSLRSASY